MTKVLFDLLTSQPTGKTKHHGGGEYIKTIFQKLCSDYSASCELSVFYDNTRFIDDWILKYIQKYAIKVFQVTGVADLRNVFANNHFDVFYSGLPYIYTRDCFPSDLFVKGTIHSIRNVEMPVDRYTYLYKNGIDSLKSIIKYWLWNLTKYDARANCIEGNKNYINCLDSFVCVSEYSKFSLLQTYSELKDENIKVYYTPSKYEDDNQAIPITDNHYILMISGNRWEKNSYRGIIALDELLESGYMEDYCIRIIGNPGKKVQKKIRNKDRFQFYDYLTTTDLSKMYANCSIFLYPTLNEGFGMPPSEAMKFGKTCILSSVCSLPEVYGDAVYWTNPTDVYEIKNRLLRAIKHRIDPKKVLEQYSRIRRRQEQDLKNICEYIIK